MLLITIHSKGLKVNRFMPLSWAKYVCECSTFLNYDSGARVQQLNKPLKVT